MKQNKALLISIGLHIVLVGLLLVSVSFTQKSSMSFAPQAQPIQAVFIDAQAIADQQRQRDQAAADARQRELEKRQAQQRKIAAEREKKRVDDAAALKKKQAEQALKEQQAQERKRTLEEQRQREQEIQRRMEEDKQRKEQLEKELSEQLAQEQQAISAANQSRVMSEVQKYQALVHQTIVQNLFDFDSFVGKTCRLNVRLAPSGLVIDVRILDGNDALCRASQAAVLRPDTLPVSKDPAVFAEFRDFNITVRPETR